MPAKYSASVHTKEAYCCNDITTSVSKYMQYYTSCYKDKSQFSTANNFQDFLTNFLTTCRKESS